MISDTLRGPTGLIDWNATDDQWLAAREGGISASDVKTALGFDQYKTPWELWAEKTGAHPVPPVSNAATKLGHDLEPWLLQMAARELRTPVTRTTYRLYAHPQHPWRMASPDGVTSTGELVEGKTAGLCGGFGIPTGWAEDSIPLGYNLQARWQMHVLDAPRVHVPALVSGLGFRLYTLERDMTVEADLVEQVTEWYERHILDGEEPPFGPGDNLLRRYPTPTENIIALDDTDASAHYEAYAEAHAAEREATAAKKRAAEQLQALIGPHAEATLNGDLIATWKTRDGSVDWKALAGDLAEAHSLELPALSLYRKPSTRTFLVKGLK